MGFSISGVILADHFDKDISKVSENLELGIEILNEVDSYEATERNENEDILFLCFSEVATLIYFEPALYDQNIYSQTTNSLNFQYFESPMIFAIRYVKDCEKVRNLMSIDGDIKFSIGRELKIEKQIKRTDELLLNLTKEISELDILCIPDEIKVYKCRITEYSGKRTRKSEREISAMLTERRISKNFTYGYDDLFK